MNHSHLKLFVVDDDKDVRDSLGTLLLSRGYAVQTFASGEAFLASGKLHDCGCVVLDLRMSGINGLQVFHELRAMHSPLVVLFLSGHGDISTAVDAVQDGAFGWLEKSCGDARLLEKVGAALDSAAAVAVRRQARASAEALWQRLTPREQEVARLVAKGWASKLIARELAPIETRTVETHRAHAQAKLGLSSPTEIERFLREHQI